MNIKSIGLAWYTVSNPATAKKFFQDTLGLTLDNESPEYGWMEFTAEDKSFRLGVGKTCDSSPEIKAGQNAVVTFTVADIQAAKAHLEKQHVTLLGDIVEVPGHVKMLTFMDTDKNLFQVVQLLY